MVKKQDATNVDATTEIKKLAGLAGEQLAAKDYDGAWQTMGALSKLHKEDGHNLSGVVSESLQTNIKNYYFQNKKMNSGAYALIKVGEHLSEISSMIKVEE